MLTLTEAQARVDKGMAWLQETGSILDFHLDQVNPETISIASESRCMLAQSGQTHYALAVLRIASTLRMSLKRTKEWAIEHGFNVPYESDHCPAATCHTCFEGAVEDSELLTAAWKTALQERKRELAMT